MDTPSPETTSAAQDGRRSSPAAVAGEDGPVQEVGREAMTDLDREMLAQLHTVVRQHARIIGS